MECHVWSDGEEDHEEEHNFYYDVNYFYIVNEPGYKLMYVWRVHFDTMDQGMAVEETSANTIHELASGVRLNSISREKAVGLVEVEVGRLKERGKYRADSRLLCEVVERAMSTFSISSRPEMPGMSAASLGC